MPQLSAQERAAFLDEPGHLVRIATVDGDGWPRVVPAWFIREGNDVLFTPRVRSAWWENAQRDPRVAISIDEEALPYRKLAAQGTVRVVHSPGDDDAWRDLYRRIAYRYIPVERADAYVDGTVDQPRALLALSLTASDTRVSTWRMPVEDEPESGVWHRRYYLEGTGMAQAADSGEG